MPETILSPKQKQPLVEVGDQLVALQGVLGRSPATPEDTVTLRDTLRRMTELFLLVVGEFNSGKSLFINSLLG